MSDVNDWLSRAAVWRFGALLFREPGPERPGELQALAPLLPAELRAAAQPIVAEVSLRNDRYFAVLGPGGCAATESAYDLAAMANRGPLLAEVSAFYESFSYPVRLSSDLAPDHLVVELDFLGFLALKVAYALYEGKGDERDVAESAYSDFRDRHLCFWLDALRNRLHDVEDSAFARAADWLCEALAGEARLPASDAGLQTRDPTHA
jgi:TorA maturation chaperone TorD